MNSTIQKWGNSQGIRIPKIILEQSGIAENDKVEIIVKDNSKILKKANKQHMTVKERLENFYGKPLNEFDAIETEETDTGCAVGEEIW